MGVIRKFIISSMIVMCCAGVAGAQQSGIIQENKSDAAVGVASAEAKVPDEIKGIPELEDYSDTSVKAKIKELKQRLMANGVPGEWFDEQLQHETFRVHPEMQRYFQKSAERKVDRQKTRDASWYLERMNLDARIAKGKGFIEAHSEIFQRAEERHGIHRELIAAIVGMETNFADRSQRGNFYAFNALVSQYIYANRMKFALREITALYRFSQRTGLQMQYFTGSYAGAIGWGQFIPSSLQAFFIDANGADENVDPFSIEDTIISVENYLYRHNLSGSNIDEYPSRYKAVFSYNPSDIYVKAVLLIYDGLRSHFYPAGGELLSGQDEK